MTSPKNLLAFTCMLFCLQSHADETSADLQKACVNEQVGLHKGIKGHEVEASNFEEYCKCETNYIVSRATKEQLNQISKMLNTKPKWLTQFKSNALKSCIAQEKQITT
jgi:hypothetical protein